MSKRSLFWGNASGKLGEAVYYRAGGEQRTRTWIPKIKNPKTLAQVETRLSMLNLVTTYKLWSDIIKTGFPLKKKSQSDYNAFVSRNKNATTSVIPKEAASAGLSVPDGMLLVDGDIPLSISGRVANDIGADEGAPFAVVASGLTMSDTKFTYEEWGTLYDQNTPITGDLVYRALVGDNNPMNLPTLFKLFVCVGVFEDIEAPAGAPDLGACNKNYCYIECSPTSKDGLHIVGDMSAMNFAFSPVETPTESKSVEAQYLMMSQNYPLETSITSGVYTAFISYTADGKQRVTTSRFLGVDGVNAGLFASYKPDGEIYDYALKEMGYNPNSIIATR